MNIIGIVVEGTVLGLTLSILIGPVFFTHLQTVIYRGFKAGNILSIGISASDIFLILLCYLGTAQLIDNKYYKIALGFVGGAVLIFFGIYTFLKKIRFSDLRPKSYLAANGVLKLLVKGFVLNFANPFVWFFWLGVVSLVNSTYGKNKIEILIFFSLVVGTYFFLNIIKGLLAFRIKRLIRPKTIMIINKFVGILLILFGIVLIFRVMWIENLLNIKELFH